MSVRAVQKTESDAIIERLLEVVRPEAVDVALAS